MPSTVQHHPTYHHPKNTRWFILFLSCMAMTGVYYSFDIPAALHQQLQDYMTSSSSSSSNSNSSDNGSSSSNHSNNDDRLFSIRFNLLYSVYSIPNIILPFFGGTLVDSLGAHTAALLFATLTLLGQLFFAVGTSYKSWNLMLLGRTLYGFGGESISVATSTLNNEWFRGKELALSFGINLAVSRLGSVVNDFVSPRVANEYGTDVAIWWGVGMNVMSVVMALGICGLTWRSRRDHKVEYSLSVSAEEVSSGDLSVPLLGGSLQADDDLQDSGISISGGGGGGSSSRCDENIQQNGSISPLDIDCCQASTHDPESDNECRNGEEGTGLDGILLQEKSNKSHDENDNEADDYGDGGGDNGDVPSQSHSCLTHILQLDKMFWMLSLSCVLVYGCVLPFNNIASGILMERNYFVDTTWNCHLQYENMCSMGDLAPKEGNRAMDLDGNACPLRKYDKPILPTRIHVNASDVDSDVSSADWNSDSYMLDHLMEKDVDCGDAFWRHACTADYCKAQKAATEMSGRVMSIPYLFSAILSPFFGHVVDRIGRRAVIAVWASVLLVMVHLSLAWSHASPVVPLIGQGLAYVCYAAVIWPSVPLTVRKESVGTAFGAMTAIQNVGLALFPLVIALIYKESHDRYVPNVEYFFVGCAMMGTVIGFYLNVLDRKRGGVLNKASQQQPQQPPVSSE